MKKLLLSISIAAAMVVTFSFVPEAKANEELVCGPWRFTEYGYCKICYRRSDGPEGTDVITSPSFAVCYNGGGGPIW